MPQLDPYNTQSAIALLRQHIDHAHWYDITKAQPILKDIRNTLVIAAMNPTSGSFFVNPRYQRHFWTCAVSFPEVSSLTIIYETFLKGHFSRFKSSIQEMTPQLIKAATSLHEKVSSQFKKTAINFHYEFNIRHISNIFAGILQTQPHTMTEVEKVIKLWFHESERIYADRLIEMAHIKTYTESALEIVKKVFGKNVVQKHYQGENPEPLVFCHFPQGYQGEKVYDLTPFVNTSPLPMNNVTQHVREALIDHNQEKVEMNLVLFEDAIKHVCRITRIISNTAGHALLVGVGGSGKQSLSKLSAFIKGYNVFSITVSKEYSMGDLKTDIVDLYNKTGVKDDQMMFLVTDSHITDEKFLVYFNDMLSSGEIADLYAEDEKLNILNVMKPKAKMQGRGENNDDVWAYFIDKVRENLHVTLCFSPIGDTFRTRARRFPALVNSTVIDWFQPWPEAALEDVSKNFLAKIDLGDDEVRKNIVKFMPESFKVVNKAAKLVLEKERRYIYNTPKSFLELIKLYTNMLNTKRKLLQDDMDNYEKGLTKLRKTKVEVAILEQNLVEKQVEVDAMKGEAEKVAEVVGKEKAIVEEENRKAKTKADACAKIKAEVEKQQSSCQADVDKLQPMVDNALKNVQNINPDDIKMVRNFNNPPPGIDQVFSCILYLFAGIPTYTESIELTKAKLPKNFDWPSIKKELLTKADVLIANLKRYPTEIANSNVPEQNIIPIQKIYTDPKFTFESIQNKSSAAASMYTFINYMLSYFEAMKQMIPKQNMLKEAQATLAEKVAELNEVQALVADLNQKLAVKQKELDEATAKKDAAQAEADKCNKKLSLARRLVTALASEETRWANSIVELTQKLSVLVGDVLISAAFISYAGPFAKQYRQQIVNDEFKKYIIKKNIPMSANFNPLSLLVTEAQIAEWNNEGLPSDDVSVENGTILTNSERYPLMIDPQLQGITWIKEKLKKDELLILKLSKKTYAFDLERAIEEGTPVMIENLSDYIDPVLMPVIARNVIKKGNKRIQIFGGKQLDLHNNFRLYMQTKLSNPKYPPEIQAEAVLINFTVTEIGLGDQLLNFVVGKERPDLAKNKKDLILQQNKFKIQLKDLERGLLDKLNKTVGDPTENIELIEGLEYSKKLATEIEEKVAKAIVTTAEINETSEFYRPAATRGALIFFLMNDLYKLSSFYMYSLESFINVIDRSVDIVANKYRADAEKKRQEAAAAAGADQKAEGTEKPKEGEAVPEGEAGAPKPEQEAAPKAVEEVPEGIPEGAQPAKKVAAPNTPAVEEPLSPRSLRKRVQELTESITYCSFSFVRRGLFEKHKLIFATMMCMKIMVSTKELRQEDMTNFIIPKKPANVNYPESESLKSYITESMYKECKGLESIEKYQGLCDSLLTEHNFWKKWIGTEKAEDEELPSKAFLGVTAFQRLMLIKILRPDRVSYALKSFIIKQMGERYIEQPPFDMQEVYDESSQMSPIFFVLFPGVDPTPSVEEIGRKYGISEGKGFINISMGQGQEERAKKDITKCALEGSWIFLQNVHLMLSWLKDLELKLEEVCPTAHKNFRVFISSEPPPAMIPLMPIIPEAILQRCIKVSNEAPADLKANMRRAYAHFSQEKIDRSSKKSEYKSILFALCYFHAVVSGRKKFGNQGWSRVYNFNDGDLTICADVLHNYLEKYEIVPYNDLIYIYGEIMYGGHITDNWDRRTNNTYLKKLITPNLLNQANLIPVETKVFRILDPQKSNFEEYRNHIEKLPDESPLMFGMHPNAEINFLLNQTEFIFQCVIDLTGETGSGGGKSDNALKDTVTRIRKEAENVNYDLLDIRDRILAFNKNEPPTPFQIVLMQECERMNQLISVMVTTLQELELGLDGALNMTDAMDSLATNLTLNRVPPAWGAFYMSRKPLDSWTADWRKRCEQLTGWSGPALLQPKPLRLSYLFNPMSFLTAIMQVTARESGLPLDNMALYTKVTNFKDGAELTAFEKKPVEKKKEEEEEDPDKKKKDEGGAYVDGFFLEGADWDTGGSGEGCLTDQKLKTLHPSLPIVKVFAIPIEKKVMRGQYPCPVYYTTMRGPTYIFTANLTMESDEDNEEFKWILAGVAAILNDDN